jgi:hypothetical protein
MTFISVGHRPNLQKVQGWSEEEEEPKGWAWSEPEAPQHEKWVAEGTGWPPDLFMVVVSRSFTPGFWNSVEEEDGNWLESKRNEAKDVEDHQDSQVPGRLAAPRGDQVHWWGKNEPQDCLTDLCRSPCSGQLNSGVALLGDTEVSPGLFLQPQPEPLYTGNANCLQITSDHVWRKIQKCVSYKKWRKGQDGKDIGFGVKEASYAAIEF